MNDEQSFLAEIQANPEDLSLRLVYADWLEEQGDARSEYLRVDVEFHRSIRLLSSFDEAADRDIKKLRARLKRLSKKFDADWLDTFDKLRPELIRCSVCKKVLSEKDAIDTNPRNHRKMKRTRYCDLCYEDAVRSQFRASSDGYGRQSSSEDMYHGYQGYE